MWPLDNEDLRRGGATSDKICVGQKFAVTFSNKAHSSVYLYIVIYGKVPWFLYLYVSEFFTDWLLFFSSDKAIGDRQLTRDFFRLLLVSVNKHIISRSQFILFHSFLLHISYAFSVNLILSHL